MDAFEDLVASLLRRQGYWTQVSYKVLLDKATKRNELSKHSLPRPEIDIVAYQPGTNEVLWVECKSYLNSPGVRLRQVTDGPHPIAVFANVQYRQVVSQQLLIQLQEQKMILPGAQLSFCLAAGHIAESDREGLQALFDRMSWRLWDETWLKEQLEIFSGMAYENEISVVVAKLLRPELRLGSSARRAAKRSSPRQ
jgi:hypothetical protein